MANLTVTFQVALDTKNICITASSTYFKTSTFVSNAEDMKKEIEEICGKGSYLLYKKYKQPNGSWDYCRDKKGSLTYIQDGFKRKVLEDAKQAMITAGWGKLPDWYDTFKEFES